MPPTDAAPYRRYRAPRSNGEALVEPAWPDLLGQVAANRSRRNTFELLIADQTLPAFAEQARRELLKAATDFSRSFSDPPPMHGGDAPLIVSGHQPEWFHPGVWFKNFALDGLAKSAGGVGVHLLIDSDLCRSASVRCPTGEASAPRIEPIAYDAAADELPYEERGVADATLVASFGERVAQALDGLVDRPLAAAMAADFTAAAAQTGNLGLALSRARKMVESRRGVATLELPMSRVGDTPSFQRFAGELLARSVDVHAAYNGALAAYRRAHRLRTPAQPLPDLGRDGDWLETPFWTWTGDDPRRRPLWACVVDGEVELSNQAGKRWTLGGDPADGLADLRSRGVKVRSRALITTLYGRLVLADLFLHGIGGAKYDEVTDDFSRRLLGVAPPPHATLTATLRLPIDHPPHDPAEEATLRHQLRELRFHPELYADRSQPIVGGLIAAKHRAVAVPRAVGSNRVRHERIERANAALQPYVESRRAEIEQQLAGAAERQRVASVLGSREYSFALFPEDDVCPRLQALTAPVARLGEAE